MGMVMKKIPGFRKVLQGLGIVLVCSIPVCSMAQDDEAMVKAMIAEAEAQAKAAQVAQAEAAKVQAEAQASDQGMKPVPKAAKNANAAEEMVKLLTELNRNVASKKGNCQAMTQALHNWHAKHQAWIDSLDYASVSADSKTIEKLRMLAAELGKNLSVCYNSDQIPNLLKQYSK